MQIKKDTSIGVLHWDINSTWISLIVIKRPLVQILNTFRRTSCCWITPDVKDDGVDLSCIMSTCTSSCSCQSNSWLSFSFVVWIISFHNFGYFCFWFVWSQSSTTWPIFHKGKCILLISTSVICVMAEVEVDGFTLSSSSPISIHTSHVLEIKKTLLS